MNISEQEFKAILKLPPDKRYQYFVKRVCDWEQIYSLYDGNSIMLNEDKNGDMSVFLFPFETFASKYAQSVDELKDSSCNSIEINIFIDEMIEKLLSHNVVNALVFPVPNGYGLNIS
jgi:hypothetical protein